MGVSEQQVGQDQIDFIEALKGNLGPDLELLAKTCLGFSRTILEKHRGYGCGLFKPQRLLPGQDPGVGILFRLSDKMSRAESLAGSTDSIAFTDTLMDMAGYCLLYLHYVINHQCKETPPCDD